MSGSNMARWGALAAMTGGVASLLESIVFPTSPKLATALLLAAYVLTAVGLAGFHGLQSEGYGRLGWAGLYTASVGSLLSSVATVVALVADEDLDLLHSIGALLLIIGYILYGVATLQARVLPRWSGVAFIVVGPITFALLGFGGSTTIVFGLFWLLLGYVLWSRRDALVQQPSPVS